MNSDIIPQGPSEILDTGAVVDRLTLAVYPIGPAALTAIVFIHPATPPNAAAIAACDMPQNGLFNLRSFTVANGPVVVIYRT